MKRNKCLIVFLLIMVICLLLAVAMVFTACKKGGGGEGETPSGGTSVTLPSGVVYRVSANTAKKDLRFSWENVTYSDLRLYNVKQDDEILIPRGMTYVDLAFRGTTEYNFEYYEDGEWKVLQPIVFYKKADLDSSAIVASYTSNDNVTLSWQQNDFAENPLYEVLIRQGTEESLVQVSGSSFTRALAEGVEYTMNFREVDSIYVDSTTEKLVVPYSYWSDPIDVCQLSSVGQIEYDDKTEKIRISKVKNAFGYRVSVYYPEHTLPEKRFVPAQEAMGHDNVLLSFTGIADLTGSFTLYVEPIGTDNVVNSDGKLYIAPKDPARQDVVMVAGVQDLCLDGDTLYWKNQSGCSYYLRGSVTRMNSITTTWNDVVNPVAGETVRFRPTDLANSSTCEIFVKPIYLQKNTFSRWASITNLFVVKAPEEVQLSGNNGGVDLTWKQVGGLSYTVRRTQDAVALPDVSVGTKSSFVLLASDLGAGDYTFTVGAVDLTKSYKVKEFSLERMDFVEHEEIGCFGYLSSTKTAMKFSKPSYKVSHIAPSGEFGSRDHIRIEITSDDTTLNYRCEQDGTPLSIDKESHSFVVYNDTSTNVSRSVKLYVVGSSDITKKRDVAIASDPESFSILKPETVPQGINVTSSGVNWTPSSYSYVVKVQEGSSMTPLKYATDYQTESFFEFSRLFELSPAFAVGDTSKTLAAGGYTVSVCYSKGYSNVSGSESTPQSGSTTEYWLDGNYATVKFYKNSVPTGQYLNERLSVSPVGEENGAFSFKINGVDLETDPNDIGINIDKGMLQAGDNVISAVLKGSLRGDNRYNIYLDSDPYLFTVEKLQAPVPQIKNSVMSLINTVTAATGYRWEVDTISSPITDELDVDLRTVLTKAKTYIISVYAIYNGTDPIFESDAAEITVTKLVKPTLYYQDQSILLQYSDGIDPASLAFHFYDKLDPDANKRDYSISTRDALDLRLSALNALLGLHDEHMLPGWYEATFTSIGNGETTLDSDVSDEIRFYKQTAPDLVFRKYEGGYRVELSFKGLYTSSYSYHQDSDPNDANGVIAEGKSTYTIVYKNMVEGTHYYTAFLNNDNANRYLPSDEAVISYYKLYRPIDFTMAKDFSSVSWSVADKDHAAYYTAYHYENAFTGENAKGETGASVSSALFSALASGESGTLTVFSVGSDSEEKRTLDSEPAVCTYSRAVTPTISFANEKGDAADNSKIIWTYATDAMYSFAFDNEVMTGAIDGMQATFPSALAAGTYALSLRECGDPVAFRLPSAYSDPVSVTKLAAASEFVKSDDSLDWSSVKDATTYIVTSNNAYKKTLVDTSYDWKTELKEAGAYALRVIARSTSTATNYVDSEPSEVVCVVKLAVPNVTLDGILRWSAVSEAEKYILTVVGKGASDTEETYVDLYDILHEAGDHTVRIQATASSTPNKQYLISEPMTVSVTLLDKPTASVDTEKGTLTWEPILGASSYLVSLGEHWWTVYDTEYDVSPLATTAGTYSVRVTANGGVADGRVYLSSAPSTEVLTVVRLAAPSFLTIDTTVTWNEVTNAAKYAVSLTGADLSENEKVTVRSYDVASALTMSGTYRMRLTALGSVSASTIVLDSVSTELTIVRLDTPSTYLTDTVFTWQAIDYATSYVVNDDNIALSRTIDISDYAAGNYDFSVQALGGLQGGILYLDSPVKDTTVHVVGLAKPTMSLNGKTLVWNVVDHATGYVVNENNVGLVRVIDLNSYGVGNYDFSLRALGGVSGDTLYLDSAVSEFSLTVVALEMTELALNGSSVEWESVANASGYEVSFDGANWAAASAFDLSMLKEEGSYTLSVRALGSVGVDTIYLDSSAVAYAVTVARLAAPILTQDDETVVWNADVNASSYRVSEDNGNNWTPATNSYDASSLTDGATLTVQALGRVTDHFVYLDSVAGTIRYTVEELNE